MGKVLLVCILFLLISLFALVAGGVGKTTMAAAVVRDSVVRNAFTRIAWVSVGQTPAIMELQRSLFNQLTGNTMPIEDGATAEGANVTILEAGGVTTAAISAAATEVGAVGRAEAEDRATSAASRPSTCVS